MRLQEVDMDDDPLGHARGKVAGPAIALLVASILSLALLLPSLGFSLWQLRSGTIEELPQPGGISMHAQVMVRIAWNVLMEIVNVVILVGAVRMMGLRSYGLAKLACTLALIPCLGPCFVVGIPFGIWGRVVLNDPAVRAAFEDGPGTPEED
jgi:hypothetical protein